MNILFLKGSNEPNGCVYHRIEVPMAYIGAGHELASTTVLDGITDDVLRKFDVVYFNGANGLIDVPAQIARLKKLGVPYVLDIDDYWVLSAAHVLAKYYKEVHADIIKSLMINAECVTTTHERLAERIRPYNGNVVVAPNCIAPKEAQWQSVAKEHDGIVFGWAGSMHHQGDIEMIYPAMRKSFGLECYWLLGGFTEGNKMFEYFDGMFSNWGKSKKYIRLPAMNVYSYAQMYDLIDVAMIPLENNLFNSMKSNLKLLEAGFKKKAVICSNVQPYKDLLTAKNSIACNTVAEWKAAIRKLYNNPNLIYDLGQQLYEDVRHKYDIENNNPRTQIFNQWSKAAVSK